MGLIYIAAGGAMGAMARYGLSGWAYERFSDSFPWGTLIVNVLGSLVLGVAVVYFQSSVTSPELKRAVTIGFLGAFTTFSAFAYESVALIEDGEWVRAGGYAVGSVVLAIAAVVAGALIATTLLRRG
jgi:CrcB protein